MVDFQDGDESRRLGELIEKLSIANGVRHDEGGSISGVLGREGHVFFGPYLALKPGPYSVRMIFSTDAPPGRDPGLSLEAVWGAEVIASFVLDETSVENGMVALQFIVPTNMEYRKDITDPRLEIRVFSQGKYEFNVTSVDLRRLNPAFRRIIESSSH